MNWILLLIFNRIYGSPVLLAIYKGLKYITYLSTGTTEIYRLCDTTLTIPFEQPEGTEKQSETQPLVPNATIIYRIDQSIIHSKQLAREREQLKSSEEASVNTVFQTLCLKKMFPSTQIPAAHILKYSLQRIYQSNQILNTVEDRIKTRYDSGNQEHEKKLLSLWSKMKPEETLENRFTKQWVDIGFQGNDPATDFRGMGLQSLDNLLYFIDHYPTHALSVLQHSAHPVHWYPYAIVGINITKFTYQLLESKRLQLYLFQHEPVMSTYEDLYCCLFYQFNQFWITHEPKLSVMDFEAKFIEFKAKVSRDLLHGQIVPLSLLNQ